VARPYFVGGWLDYLIEYRDAFAHRIPLYIPPGGVPTKNVDAYNDLSRRISEALYVKNDWDRIRAADCGAGKVVSLSAANYAFSKRDDRPFRVQMLTDFITVEEIGYKMLDEIAAAGCNTEVKP
jgi:hypothetical protein